jgi:hypothetical protein
MLRSPGVAARMWDDFYKRNRTRFFRDRHYLDREFPDLMEGAVNVLEVITCFEMLSDVMDPQGSK